MTTFTPPLDRQLNLHSRLYLNQNRVDLVLYIHAFDRLTSLLHPAFDGNPGPMASSPDQSTGSSNPPAQPALWLTAGA